jgi:hypothetical protein
MVRGSTATPKNNGDHENEKTALLSLCAIFVFHGHPL